MQFKKAFLTFLITLLIIPNSIYAYSEYLYAGGENIGIQIKSKGVLIVGSYEINNKNTMQNAKLQVGDTITHIDGKEIESSNDLIESIKNKADTTVTYKRGNKAYNTKLEIIKEKGIYKTGLYIKDNITGIGTLTFIDPDTKSFGALGHECAH